MDVKIVPKLLVVLVLVVASHSMAAEIKRREMAEADVLRSLLIDLLETKRADAMPEERRQLAGDQIPLSASRAEGGRKHDHPWGYGHPSAALDGNTDGNYAGGSCTHTAEPVTYHSNWWGVSLTEETCVGRVKIYNRVDCCENRLIGAVVRVGNNPDHWENPACGRPIDADAVNSGQLISVECERRGDYISIETKSNSNHPLSLCEVKAYYGTCDKEECTEDTGGYFSCNGGGCAWSCDGAVECAGGEDESGCNYALFECANGKTIAAWLECDGTDHCGDNSDEPAMWECAGDFFINP